MKATILLLLITFVCFEAEAQSDQTHQPYYYQIPDYPEPYSAETVAARLIDGLGFRYFWATEGLRAEVQSKMA